MRRDRKRKMLGQHFIIDDEIFERQCKYAELNKKDVVLEIGAGDGRLTRVIAKYAKKVIAIEKDRELARIARYHTSSFNNVEIIEGDFLEIDLPPFNKIVSNIPFSISSLILEKIFNYRWDVAVMTFQKEFAERFFAKPGERNYSRITLLVNFYSSPKMLERVPKGKFYPVPKVEVVIVRLDRKDNEIDSGFWNFIRTIFKHKKKLIKNALEDEDIYIQLPEEFVSKRVFKCSLEELVELYLKVKDIREW